MVLQGAAFIFVLLFLVSLMGRWLQFFTWSPWELLQESQELEEDPRVKELQRSVVELEVRRGSAVSRAQGTGFNIDADGLVVTNRHLVEDAAAVRITFQEKGSYRAVSWEMCEEEDLAVLELEPEEELPYVDLAREDAVRGDDLLVIGNPMQLSRVASRGKLLGFDDPSEEDSPSAMVLQAPIHQGSSGSPVFNQENRVVGVVYATVLGENDEPLGVAVTVSALHRFLSN